MKSFSRRLLLAAIVTALPVLPFSAQAQNYPDKPVKLVVGFAAGGPTDILARIFATAFGKALGTSVIVDNKGGGGGAIGAQAVARSDPDGYTLMFAGDGQLALLPQMMTKAGYETKRDFVPIGSVAGQSNVLIANKASGITDLPSLLAQAKAHPGRISFGSAGNGTPTHLVAALFENATGVKLLHVPYRGAGPAMADLLGGQTNLMFVGTPVALQQASRPQMAVIAITGNKRSPSLPQVPTFAEAGIRGMGDETAVWWAVVAPAQVPQAIQAKLVQAMKTAMADPELRAAIAAQGADVLDKDGATVTNWIARDHARWAGLIKSKKITTE